MHAPKLLAIISRFNELSCWAAFQVLKAETPQERVLILCHLVKVAKVPPRVLLILCGSCVVYRVSCNVSCRVVSCSVLRAPCSVLCAPCIPYAVLVLLGSRGW